MYNLMIGFGILIPISALYVLLNPNFLKGFGMMVVCTGGLVLIPLLALGIPVVILTAYTLGVLVRFIISVFSSGRGVSAEKSATAGTSMTEQNEKKVVALCSYINESLRAGYSVERITKDLRIAGWSEETIRAAFSLTNVPTSMK